MKKLLCVVSGLLLFAMIGAPNAHADSYTPTFNCTVQFSSDFGCYYVPNGYTAPAVSFPSPTVQLTVNNELYDLTLPVGDAPTGVYTWHFGEGNGALVFPYGITLYGDLGIDDLTTGMESFASDFLGYGFAPPLEGEGALTFSPVSSAAPEPASVFLMLLGAGLILFMRKRFIMRTPRTA